MDIATQIGEIEKQLRVDLSSVKQAAEIEPIHVKYLGRKGQITSLMDYLKQAPPEARPELGKRINQLKQEAAKLLAERASQLESQEFTTRLSEEKIDVTLPGRRRYRGVRHVSLAMMDELLDIFIGMGFTVQWGPEIESDYYNFEALNFPKDHPARDMQDTFYITSDTLLRTQTSNAEVRVMASSTPPIRVVVPGKCYRNEDISSRSHVIFHQIELIYIDKGVTFADLLSTIEEFTTKFFKREVELRFRPSYFPFVEPGLEVDVRCHICDGKGCPVCKRSGWLELMGAGMVHPEVMRYGGIDPEEYTGYAVGMGPDRYTMMR